MFRWIGMFIYGGCSGVFVASGVFTVLLAVGLTPRFAGKTGTADMVLCYENSIIAGTVFGTICSITKDYLTFQMGWIGQVLLAVAGFFIGIFVGCLALAIAEMLDSIPIFARRVGFRHGLGIAIFFIALGKLIGSLAYFLLGLSSQ